MAFASAMDSNTVPADVRWAIANWPENAERGEVSRFCERHDRACQFVCVSGVVTGRG